MPKALIIGPDFHNFNSAAAAAFSSLGYNVKTLAYGTPVDPYDASARLKYKLAADKAAARETNRLQRQQHFRDEFDAFAPDLVFVLNGEILLGETLDYFRRSACVALWCFDSVKHIPLVEDHILHVDRCWCYDRGDIDYYAGRGLEALFLPQAADTAIYHPIPGTVKDIDILFVGDLYHSPRRQEYISRVVRAFPNRRIKVAGIYKPWYKNPVKCLLRERRDVFTNHNLPPEEVNALYNRARVVLNIHNEQQSDGANPKVFEICASGAYQVCDANPYISGLFPSGEVGLYDNPDQMLALVEEALQGGKEENARRAADLVRREHTFCNRMKTVADDCALLQNLKA